MLVYQRVISNSRISLGLVRDRIISNYAIPTHSLSPFQPALISSKTMTLEAKQEIHSPSSSYMLQEHNLQTYSSPLAYPSSVDINLVAYHSFFCIWTYIQWVNITNLVAHFIASSSILGVFQQHPENHNHRFC
jgi:hypothetical protein